MSLPNDPSASAGITCPDCGYGNPPGSVICGRCNFPLTDAPSGPAASVESDSGEGETDTAPPAETPVFEPPIRPLQRTRMRRPQPASSQALWLWLIFGSFAAIVVVFIAIKANVDRANAPVEGSNEGQQKSADQFRAALAKDSTNADAHIGLANVLYDTQNWSEAIVHYRAALRSDSTRTQAAVDLGVCYYNLGDATEAERLFQLALARDPHHPVALFNLGIVYEARAEHQKALTYFHRALESGPPDAMRQPIIEAMERVAKASGKTAPPLPGGQ